MNFIISSEVLFSALAAEGFNYLWYSEYTAWGPTSKRMIVPSAAASVGLAIIYKAIIQLSSAFAASEGRAMCGRTGSLTELHVRASVCVYVCNVHVCRVHVCRDIVEREIYILISCCCCGC